MIKLLLPKFTTQFYFLFTLLLTAQAPLHSAAVEPSVIAHPSVARDNEDKLLKLYHDADWSNHVESAQSIWRGVETALSEIEHKVQGYRLELVKKDHSGNVARSRKNMTDFLNDPQALLIVTGVHSPPLIKHRTFINENKILTLVPWAAGGPITRHPAKENWIFRVSIDDTKAGEFLVNHAVETKQCTKPHLLLENTPWGLSNLNSMSIALSKHDHLLPQVSYFDWNTKSHVARSKIINIIKRGSDCLLLVANAIESAVIATAMADMPTESRLPIISHWGITAGQFHQEVPLAVRQKLDLSFIQTCFSFANTPFSEKGEAVLSSAKALFPKAIENSKDITSPVGFIHGYDSTQLLIGAITQVKLTDDMENNRNLIRSALENLNEPIEGLVKTYQKPFSTFSDENTDAHEALGIKDYCMAYYGNDNEILLLANE